ncbi:MAG: hypothetical protein ACK56F_00940 [bacterium]
MLRELREPGVRDGDAFMLLVPFFNLESFLGGLRDDVLHVLLAQGTQYPEEELALGELVGELLLAGQVL